jgi:hypothetical protein
MHRYENIIIIIWSRARREKFSIVKILKLQVFFSVIYTPTACQKSPVSSIIYFREKLIDLNAVLSTIFDSVDF